MASFLVDENLSPKLAVWLRRLGHKAEAVRETELKGKSDDEIIDWAENHNLIIILYDNNIWTNINFKRLTYHGN